MLGPERFALEAVLGLLAVGAVAAIAIPHFLAAKIYWNDWAANATLRNLVSVQTAFRDGKRVDVDGDGIGEFGTFGEMTGAGVRLDDRGGRRGAPLSPTLLSAALSTVDGGGRARKSGYFFRILLPGHGGIPVREGTPGAPLSGPLDSEEAEVRWCAYAWPVQDFGELKGDHRFHHRVSFVDANGGIWQTLNQDRRYFGTEHGPSWDAAMPEDGWGVAWASPPAEVEEYRGRDGNVWKRTD